MHLAGYILINSSITLNTERNNKQYTKILVISQRFFFYITTKELEEKMMVLKEM